MDSNSSDKPVVLSRTSAISLGVVLMVMIPIFTFGAPKLWSWAKGTGQAEVKSELAETRLANVEEATSKLTENMQVLTGIVKRIEVTQAKQAKSWTYAHEILQFELNKNRVAADPIHPDDVIKYFEPK